MPSNVASWRSWEVRTVAARSLGTAHGAHGDRPTRPGWGHRLLGPVFFPVSYFLRQRLLLWAAVIASGAEVTAMVQQGRQWRGDLLWTIDWLPVAFMIAGPVVAGCAAVETARSANGAAHLFRNPVTRTPAFAVTVSYAAVLGAVHLLVLAFALALSMPPVSDRWAVLAVLCQVLVLAFFAALGSAVGRFAGPVLAGACGALCAFAMVYLASSPAHHLVLLETGGATIPRIGYAYNPGYLAWQVVALLLAMVALLVPRPLDSHRRCHITTRDTVTAGVAVTAVMAISLTVTQHRLTAVDEQPTYCGVVKSIVTCFYPQHKRVARNFEAQFLVLVDSARNMGYEQILPAQVAEASRTRLPQTVDSQTAAFFVQPNHLQGAQPTLWEIASGIVQPTHCPQLRGEKPPPKRYWEDLEAVTATWVELAKPGAAKEMGYFGRPLAPAQTAKIVQGFRTCTYPYF